MGRMNVKLILHGGAPALLDVMEGLTQRNARAIRTREAPALSSLNVGAMRYVAQPTWFDAPSAWQDGIASAGTLAAWKAGELRANYSDDSVRVAMVSGVPVVVSGFGDRVRVVDDPSQQYGRVATAVQPIVGDASGKVTEYLVLAIDDDGSAVVDIGNAIARHNARQIKARKLPSLYSSKIRYKPEGSPEQWLDAQEIVLRGADDCEGLSAYRAGELLAAGEIQMDGRLHKVADAGVYVRKIEVPTELMGGSGSGRLFHALTRMTTRDGKVGYDDPSARLGMPVPNYHARELEQKRAAGRL